jgi:two-component system, sensor histidine kinase and response regulator
MLLLGVGVVGVFWYQARQRGRLLTRQNIEIEAQAAQLAELNDLKDKLFSMVSHDLRGPVTSLLQSIDRLETASLNTVAEALPRFRQSVSVVAGLTENLLCWSLAQMDGLHTRPQAFDLRDVLTEVLALYQEPFRQKQLTTTVLPDATPPTNRRVLADENQTEIAIRNIVQNALKFSPVGGQLTFCIEQTQDRLTLLVTDEGPGFRWEPTGTGADKLQTRSSQSGTGLGLVLVEELMRLNGGSVQITPRPEQVGTVVRLTWPLSPIPAIPVQTPTNGSLISVST